MKTLLILAFVLVLLSIASAQENTTEKKEFVITKHNGIEYIGIIVSDDGREVLIETESLGKIYIPKTDIKSIIELEDKKSVSQGEYVLTGPFTTRYAFTNNSLPIKKREHYAMVNLYGPEVHFAVTNNLNLGLMTTWIASPMILAMKYSFKTDESKFNYSFGTLFGTTSYLNNFEGFGGLHWLSMTYGNRKNNITFSAGYAYAKTGSNRRIHEPGVYLTYNENEIPYHNANPLLSGPIFSIAGIYRISGKASIFFDSMVFIYNFESDNMTYQDSGVLDPYGYPLQKITVTNAEYLSMAMFIMPGMRFQQTDRRAFQIALTGVYVNSDREYSFPFPMCSWFFRF